MIVKLSEKDNRRVGNGWMHGRLLDGDLGLVVQHSGDCFWNVYLLEHNFTDSNNRPLYRRIAGSQFGTYVCGELFDHQPTDQEFHKLMADEVVFLSSEVKAA